MEKLITQQDLGLSQNTAWGRWTSKMLMKILALNRFNLLCAGAMELKGAAFARALLDRLETTAEMVGQTHLPTKTGAVVVANCPHGLFDLLATVAVLGAKGRQVKVLINSRLADMDPFRDSVIGLGDVSGYVAAHRAVDFVRQGGVLIVFPAEDVSGYSRILTNVADSQWNDSVMKIAKHAAAPIIPLFIEGRNSRGYLLLAKCNRSLSFLGLVREFLRVKYVKINMVMGECLEYEQVGRSATEVSNFVRASCYLLSVNLDKYTLEQESCLPLTMVNENAAFDFIKMDMLFAISPLGVKVGEKDGFTSYLIDSKLLGEVGFYDKQKDDKKIRTYNKVLLICDKQGGAVFSASLVIPDGKGGEIGHAKLESHKFFEFAHRKIEDIVQNAIEISNISYRKDTIVSGFDGLLSHVFHDILSHLSLRYAFGVISFTASEQSLGFAVLTRYLKARMWSRRLSRLVLPRGAKLKLRTSRTVTDSVRAVRNVDLLVKLLRDVGELEFDLPPLVRGFFIYGGQVASLGVEHLGEGLVRCNVMIVVDSEPKTTLTTDPK